MNIWKRITLALLLATVFMQCPRGVAASPTVAGAQDSYRKINFSEYLDRMGTKLDCYFTLETQHLSDNTAPQLYGELIDDREDIDSVQSLIAILPQLAPGITVFRAADNQAVIHIVQDPILADKHYVLNDVLDYNFSGDLSLLPYSLGKRLEGRLRSPRGGDITLLLNLDATTYIHLSAKGVTVRQLLTNYLPLSTYSRILWNTETLTWQGKTETWVQFYGPHIANQDYSYMGSNAAEHFENGQVTYLFGSGSGLLRLMAVRFIETHLSHGQPLQTRWAMLYLGKQEDEQSIPVLIKYLGIFSISTGNHFWQEVSRGQIRQNEASTGILTSQIAIDH